MRRAHDALAKATLATDSTTGEKHYYHHIAANGYYRGQQVLVTKSPAEDEE